MALMRVPPSLVLGSGDSVASRASTCFWKLDAWMWAGLG